MGQPSPREWGQYYWYVIHSTASKYTPSKINSNSYIALIGGMINLLPCNDCKDHFKALLKRYPLSKYLHSNEALFNWSYVVHDAVNKRLGKVSPSLKDVRAYYYSCGLC